MIWALFQTYLRSFFLQTWWNYERMQNIGFAFSIVPLLRRLHASKQNLRRAVRRHLAFFNTHPYFSTIVMGVVYAKEEGRGDRLEHEDPTLTVLKDSMGGAFGAIGDHVIWGTWRPFCAVMALGVGLLVAYPGLGTFQRSFFDTPAPGICAQWWVVGFISVFNSIHLWLRWRGLQKAVHDGPMVVRWVQSLHLQAWAAQIRRIGLLLTAGIILVYLARWRTSEILLWMVAVLLGSMIVKRWALSSFVIFYVVCAVSVAMTLLGLYKP